MAGSVRRVAEEGGRGERGGSGRWLRSVSGVVRELDRALRRPRPPPPLLHPLHACTYAHLRARAVHRTIACRSPFPLLLSLSPRHTYLSLSLSLSSSLLPSFLPSSLIHSPPIRSRIYLSSFLLSPRPRFPPNFSSPNYQNSTRTIATRMEIRRLGFRLETFEARGGGGRGRASSMRK